MSSSRRTFLGLGAAGLAARALGATGLAADLLTAAPGRRGAPTASLRLKAVAFDAFPIFSPAAVVSRAEALLPGRGAALTDEWRIRQFEYAWLRVLSRRYADFWRVTEDALAFAAVLSTDQARTYKPDPRAYGLGTEALGFRRQEVLFVAHAGWDAAGAKAFGYPTFWVNRADLPAEELGALPDAAGRDLHDLVRFIERPGAGGGR